MFFSIFKLNIAFAYQLVFLNYKLYNFSYLCYTLTFLLPVVVFYYQINYFTVLKSLNQINKLVHSKKKKKKKTQL